MKIDAGRQASAEDGSVADYAELLMTARYSITPDARQYIRANTATRDMPSAATRSVSARCCRRRAAKMPPKVMARRRMLDFWRRFFWQLLYRVKNEVFTFTPDGQWALTVAFCLKP